MPEIPRFIEKNVGATKESIIFQYLKKLSLDINMSQLLQAGIAYLFFQGEKCSLLYSAVTGSWYVWNQRWKICKGSLGRVKAHFQTTFLVALRSVASRVKAERTFPNSASGEKL